MDMRSTLLCVMKCRFEEMERRLARGDDARFLVERSCEAINALATFGEIAGLLTSGEATETHAGIGTMVYGEAYAAGYFGAVK